MSRAQRRGRHVVSFTETITLHGDEVEVDVRARFTAGTPDRGPDFACAGGYPGDPPEVEILSLTDQEGGDVPEKLLSKRDSDRIEAAAAEQAISDARDAEELAADMECDRRRDDALTYSWADGRAHVCAE